MEGWLASLLWLGLGLARKLKQSVASWLISLRRCCLTQILDQNVDKDLSEQNPRWSIGWVFGELWSLGWLGHAKGKFQLNCGWKVQVEAWFSLSETAGTLGGETGTVTESSTWSFRHVEVGRKNGTKHKTRRKTRKFIYLFFLVFFLCKN